MTHSNALDWIKSQIDFEYPHQTRIHALNGFSGGKVFIKREDELSSGVIGSKLRKYASLIPFLIKKDYTDIALIGGPNSNNLLGLLQLLKERHINPWIFTRATSDAQAQANALFIAMLSLSEQTFRIGKDEWKTVEAKAENFAAERQSPNRKTFVLPEGALCREALAGALYLSEDILRNESEKNEYFTHLFIDSGTGLSAIGLVLGIALLDKESFRRCIHVTLIAGTREEFRSNLERFREHLPEPIRPKPDGLPSLAFHAPPIAKSYGSVTPSILKACKDIAREQGILMDPVYSVKSYMSLEQVQPQLNDGLNSLFIYNGGSLGIAGFIRKLHQHTS